MYSVFHERVHTPPPAGELRMSFPFVERGLSPTVWAVLIIRALINLDNLTRTIVSHRMGSRRDPTW